MAWRAHLLLLCLAQTVQALDNGLARTPPLGWITGERFFCNTDCDNYPDDCISERLVRGTVDALSGSSFSAAGFRFLSLGDCWMSRSRDERGRLQPDPRRFPSGMRDLAAYVHSKGLKLGVYLDTGNLTCNGFPGSQGHLQLDAETLTDWRLDMVKLNGCNTQDPRDYDTVFPQFSKYLNQTGRSVLFLCEWPNLNTHYGRKVDLALVSKTCNMYKVRPDMTDSWLSLLDLMKYFGDNAQRYANYSGPGSYLLTSELLVGDYGLSFAQQRLQMALWSLMASPLLVSADLRHISRESRSILLNQLALKINQDPLGALGTQIKKQGQVRVWRKPVLPSGSFALAVTYENISGGPTKVSLKLQDIGFTTAARYNFTDVFSGHHLGIYKPWYTLDCEVEPTGVTFIYAQALP